MVRTKRKACDAPPQPHVLGLPDALWLNIFSFVGNAVDFRSLELTCKPFHATFQQDAVWECCSGREIQFNEHNDFGHSHRDEAFARVSCQRIEKWQNSTHNILLDVCGQRWKEGVEHLLNESEDIYENVAGRGAHRFVLRGDTTYVLACLVEENMMEVLKRAQLSAFRSSYRREGHSVLPSDIQPICEAMIPSDPDPGLSTQLWISRQIQDMYVRRLAFRAGITKLDNGAYGEIFLPLWLLSFQLAIPACVALASSSRQLPISEHQKMVIEGAQRLREVPPHPKLVKNGDVEFWEHIIVPSQIEAAAARCRLPYNKVYGNEWWCNTGDNIDGDGGEAIERERSYT